MRFQYILSGWAGSTADGAMYSHSRLTDLQIPDGKYYLADAGFGVCDICLFRSEVFAIILQNGVEQIHG
jgi:hypothetical protein